MKKKLFPVIFMFSAFLMFSGCVSSSKVDDSSTAPPPEKLPSLEEQEKIAMEEFGDMLELTANRSHYEMIDEIEAGYLNIIRKAPDSYLAEESHFRLVIHYFEHPDGPQVEKAEDIYRQYFERYENPKMAFAINTTMARMYFNFKQWEGLSKFMVPFIKKYVETGELRDPLFLFYYSEARFYLEDYEEASRGYRMLIRENPASMELNHARRRLVEIRHKLDPTITKE
jgi:tetratricopeptide (TPR) repeat protein